VLEIIPEISFINNFVEHPPFLQAWAELGQGVIGEAGLRHIPLAPIIWTSRGVRFEKVSVEGYLQLGACCNNMAE